MSALLCNDPEEMGLYLGEYLCHHLNRGRCELLDSNAFTLYGKMCIDDIKKKIIDDISNRNVLYVIKDDIYDTRASYDEMQDVVLGVHMFGTYKERREVVIRELRKIEDITEGSVDNTLNGVYRVYHIRLSDDMVITYSYRHAIPHKIHVTIFKMGVPIYYNYNDVTVDTRGILNSVISIALGRIVRMPNSIPIPSMEKSLTEFEMNIFKESIINLKNAVDNIIELKSTPHDCVKLPLFITQKPKKSVTVNGKEHLYESDINENPELVSVLSKDKEKESPIKKEKFNAFNHLNKWLSLGGKK